MMALGGQLIPSLRSASWLLAVLLPAQVPAPTPSVGDTQPAPVELGAVLDSLVANAEQYRATLPSLTADEHISSEASFLGIFKDHAEAQATMRVIRASPGKPLQESRQIAVMNGKPVEPGKTAKLPVTLFGGFGHFQDMFFTPQHRVCFSFTLLPEPGPDGTLQIGIAGPAAIPAQPGCQQDREGLTGLARVDRATGQLVHLERTIPENVAAKGNLAPFASIDCAPTKVGDETFWLPTVVIGRVQSGKIRGQFIAHYSNYHRYTASIKLLPGATEVAPTESPD